MKVTDESWAEQVDRADKAQLELAKVRAAVELVLREHDSCLCRHARRILGEQKAPPRPIRVPRPSPDEVPITVADGTRGMERGR